MSKQLIQASLNLDLAKSYDPAQEAVAQIGKAVDSYVKYEEQQSEKAYQIAENLQEGMVGFDLMNDQAQDYYEKELSNIATDLASARAKKDSKEVRRLLAKGKSLVDDQNKIGEIIYAHSQDKLSDNYVTGANTHELDLLINKEYRIKENKDGERIVVFSKSANQKLDLGGKEGILLSELDKFAIPKDTNIAADYLKTLSAVARQAQAGKTYQGSPGQNSVNVVINKVLKDVDGLQNALFTEDFQLKDGKRIADLYYEEKGSQLPMNEFISKFMTPGREDYNTEELTSFVREKLQAGAVNYNDFYFKEDESKAEKGAKTDKFGGFSQYSDTGGDPDADVNSFQSIPYSDKITRRKSLLNLETVPGAHYTYKYDGNDNGGWQAFDGTKFVRNMNGADIARIEGLMSANDSSFSDFNVGKVKSDLDEKELQPKKPGTVGLGSINIEGNTTKDQVRRVANNLEEVFDENFKNEFDISVVSQNRIGGGGMFGGSSRTTTTPNKIRIKSKDGSFDKIYDIGTNATQKTVDQINIDFADYIAIDSSYED